MDRLILFTIPIILSVITVSLPLKLNADEPLFLTPFLKKNQSKEARHAALVNFPDFGDLHSYSGYFTVNEKFNSNIFFWFFPSQSNYETDPVLLWLQGGPGASSMIGLFSEHGPFHVNAADKVTFRNSSWIKTHSVIYMDNPVGSGFSFSDEGGYATTYDQVGENLFNALEQFFLMFPSLQDNDFYVTGESFAGKYVPVLSHLIHKTGSAAKVKINLKGLSIGNGFVDPVNQMEYGDYLYQVGLIDSNARDVFHKTQNEIVDLVKKGEYLKAADAFNLLIDGDDKGRVSFFTNVTGFQSHFNIMNPIEPGSGHMKEFLERKDVRSAIHVGNMPFHQTNAAVRLKLKGDALKSVADHLVALLSHHRVLIYNGQLDIIFPYVNTVNYLRKMNFSGSENYSKAQRHIWKVDKEIAGYVKYVGNLTEVLLRNAGHESPKNQPEWAYDLIHKFTRNQKIEN